MLKITVLTLATGLALASSVSARTNVYYGFNIGISNAPPPPRIYYREEPEMYMVPGSRVYVVEDDQFDCDVFQVGSYWYAQNNGYWYRASSYRGPFRVVDVRRVPRAVFAVPARNWHHHPHGGPPGLTRRYDDGDRYGHERRYKNEGKHKYKDKHGNKHGKNGRYAHGSD